MVAYAGGSRSWSVDWSREPGTKSLSDFERLRGPESLLYQLTVFYIKMII